MSVKDRLADLTAAQDLDFLASVVAGIWGEKARAEALTDLSGGDARVAEALAAASALGGKQALTDTLAALRPGWRPKKRGLDELLHYASFPGDRPR